MSYRADVFGIFNEATGELEALTGADLATPSKAWKSATRPIYTSGNQAMLESFDQPSLWALTGCTVAADTVAVKGQALKVNGNGAAATAYGLKTGYSIDPTTLGQCAFWVSKSVPCLSQSGLGLQLGNVSNAFCDASAAGQDNFTSLGNTDENGGYWWSFYAPNVANMPAGPITQIRARLTNLAPYVGGVSFDAFYSGLSFKATFCLTFDDCEVTAYTKAFPYMQSRGIVGTVYVPTAQVGNANKLTWSMIRELKAAGWTIALDGTADDTQMTAAADAPTAVSNLQKQFATLAANGCASDGQWHFCYPNGTINVPATPVQITSLTGNGTTSVTISASTVANGMAIYAAGLPAGATIVSGGGAGVTSLVLSVNAPAATVAAMAVDESGAFYPGKLVAELVKAGFKTGRSTSGLPNFTRFGFGPQNKSALFMTGSGVTGRTLNQEKPRAASDVLRGGTRVYYMHKIDDDVGGWTADTANVSINVYYSFFTGLVDQLAAYRDAGQADVLSIAELWDRDSVATAP